MVFFLYVVFFLSDTFHFTATSVNCEGRNMTEIPAVLLGHGGLEIHGLDLSHNQVTHVDLAFLRHLPALRSLSLRANGVRALSKKVHQDFKPLYSLTHIDLSDNVLHVIHPYVFTGFPHLKTLNLSGNVLHTISENAFNLPRLQTLDLSRNQLEVVYPHFFSSSPESISEIDLSRNGISRLNDGTFGHIREVSNKKDEFQMNFNQKKT